MTTVKQYLEQYGQIEIEEKDWKFHSNGINAIGGKFKAKDLKNKGMF